MINVFLTEETQSLLTESNAKGNESHLLYHLHFKPAKQNQTYPGKPSYRLIQESSLLTSQKQLQTKAPKIQWV